MAWLVGRMGAEEEGNGNTRKVAYLLPRKVDDLGTPSNLFRTTRKESMAGRTLTNQPSPYQPTYNRIPRKVDEN